jgi:23S rRNA (uridine2552-2'-O)-methyltransferase
MDRRKDAYYAKAKAAGYRSRAAYKLIELQRRYHFLRRGDYVIDLGAAPGAWLQVAREIVGPSGKVVGLDIVPITPLTDSNVVCVVADVLDPEARAKALAALGRRPAVVLSDMAPKLTGVRPRDLARCSELEQAALDFAVTTLASGGRFLSKILGDPDISAAARKHFATAKLTRPDATRRGSAEAYLVASGIRR